MWGVHSSCHCLASGKIIQVFKGGFSRHTRMILLLIKCLEDHNLYAVVAACLEIFSFEPSLQMSCPILASRLETFGIRRYSELSHDPAEY